MSERLIRPFFERVSIDRGSTCMSKLVERLKGCMIMNIECEKSFTPRDICSAILKAHGVFINSEPFTSESYERTFERTLV